MRGGRVLITGGAGALGREVARACVAQGLETLICGRRPPSEPLDGAVFHAADLLTEEGVRSVADLRPESVIHAAWTTAHPDYWTDLANCAWQAASLRLFDAFAAAGGAHFGFVSTCADRSWAPGGPDLGAATLYGASKRLTAEMLMRRSAQTGVPVAVGRVYFPYSAGETPKRVTSLVVDAALKGEAFHLRSGDVYRDIFSARSAGCAFAALTMAGARGVFDIASGGATHLGRFLRDDIAGRLGGEALVTWDAYDPAQEDPAANPRVLVGDPRALAQHVDPPRIEEDEIDVLIEARRATV